jgi:hypothetical protein
LQEKLLKVEAEIAIIDDRIEGVKKMAMEAEKQQVPKDQQKESSGGK